MKTIHKIDLVFENCEYITLYPKNIGMLDVEGLKDTIRRTAINSIDKITTANSLMMEIFPDGIDTSGLFQIEKITAKERLAQYNDITSVNFVYEDDTVEVIFVPWGEESDYSNEYQKTFISSLGNIYIVIDKEKELSDVFDNDSIDNEDEVNFRKQMVE